MLFFLIRTVAPFVEDWVGELKKAWQTLMQAHIAQLAREVVVAAYNKVRFHSLLNKLTTGY